MDKLFTQSKLWSKLKSDLRLVPKNLKPPSLRSLLSTAAGKLWSSVKQSSRSRLQSPQLSWAGWLCPRCLLSGLYGAARDTPRSLEPPQQRQWLNTQTAKSLRQFSKWASTHSPLLQALISGHKKGKSPFLGGEGQKGGFSTQADSWIKHLGFPVFLVASLQEQHTGRPSPAGSKMHGPAPLSELRTCGNVGCSSPHRSHLLAQLKPPGGFSSHWVLLWKAVSPSSFGSSTGLGQNGSTEHYRSLNAQSCDISGFV